MAETPKLTLAQGVTLGLALIIGGLVWDFRGTVSDMEDKLEEKFVSKAVFETEMASIRREAEIRHGELLRRLDTLEGRIEVPHKDQ